MDGGHGEFILTTIPVVGEDFVGNQEPLLYVRWHERVYEKDDQGNDAWWHQRRELTLRGQDMKEEMASSTGSQFFHKLVYRYEQERAKRTAPKTNGQRTMASNCTRPLNGPQKGICC